MKSFSVILGALVLLVTINGAALAQSPLAAALQASRVGDWDEAARLARQIESTASRDVIEWTRLRASRGSMGDYQAFLNRNPDWPGLPLLVRRGERAIPRNAAPQDVIEFFGGQDPQTGIGVLRLAAALKATGDTTGADAHIVRAWREFVLTGDEHDAFVERHGKVISPHHEARLDRLLWDARETQAKRMYPLVSEGWRKLAVARLGLRDQVPGVDGLIAAVPGSLADNPGLAFERFIWRARKGRADSAREILAARSTSAEALARPEEWANRRRSLARDLMRDDRDREAYRLASRHFLTGGRHYADLEWLSGFIALRKLDDPETALGHFRDFRASIASPISLGRAGYWEGRALEALGRSDEAAAAYAFAARYQTSFYGQLAAERAGLPTDPELLGTEEFPDWRGASFLDSSVLKAALELDKSGEKALSERFLVHLCESLSPVEMGQLADIAFELEEPHVALMIAKFAARSGTVLQRAYHPVTDLVSQSLPVEPALALAIARRESEFDPVVVSPAGARGLMQLMPRTGQAMASKLGERFTATRLTRDPKFNARLGAAYLAELRGEFGDNITLISVGYNAGPSRARSWSARFGDPRSPGVDVVDWIEHVPFRETRNYIMRVTESLIVYEMRLANEVRPMNVTARLKAR